MHRLFLVALALTGCTVGIDGAASGPPTDAPLPVTTRVVGATDLPVTATAPATLLADATVALRAEVGGRVVDVGFEDGDEVDAGAVLVRLHDAAARADVAAAEAQLALATAEAERAARLRSLDRTSQADLDTARANQTLAAADLDRARDALRQTSLRAPRAGRVAVRGVEPGDVVDAGTLITTLVDTTPLRAELALPEHLAADVAVGATATLAVDAVPGERFAARVDYVAPQVDPASRLLAVRLVVTDPPGPLLPGMAARAEVRVREGEPTILVPSEAVTTTAAGPMVWVVEDGRARTRSVVLGLRRADDVVVREGLVTGDTVIVRGIVRLRDGVLVTSDGVADQATP